MRTQPYSLHINHLESESEKNFLSMKKKRGRGGGGGGAFRSRSVFMKFRLIIWFCILKKKKKKLHPTKTLMVQI